MIEIYIYIYILDNINETMDAIKAISSSLTTSLSSHKFIFCICDKNSFILCSKKSSKKKTL